MFKRTATNLVTQPTMMQQTLTCALKKARLLPDGWCYLSDKGNEILFRINTSPPLITIAGLDGAGQCLGLPGHWTSHQWTSSYGTTLKPRFTCCQLIEEDLIARIVVAAATWHFWAHMSVSAASSAVYPGWSPYVWISAWKWYAVQLFFWNTSVVLLDFQP